ncbi:MAG: ABC transporter substrate-binding protein [Bacillota bacterium]
MNHRNRGLVRLALIVLVALLVSTAAACQRAEPPKPAPAAPAPTVPTPPQPKPGGTLVLAVGGNPVSLDPALMRDWISRQAIINMYDSLVDLNEKEEVVPSLAKSWRVEEGGLRYVFELRDDVLFHDGTRFNAEAVKFNYDRMLDPAFNSRNLATLSPVIARVEVLGEFTVAFNLKRIDVDFLTEMSWSGLMVSPTAARLHGVDFARNPVGTGPFAFKAFEPDSHLDLVRNDKYWRGAPLVDGIRVRIIPEASTRNVELEAGNLHISYHASAKDRERLKRAGLVVEERTTASFQMLSFNLADGPTAELAVRNAIARAIDRDIIIQQVLHGAAQKSRAGVPSTSPYYHADVPMIEYNTKEAERILDQAGWVKGADGIRRKGGELLKIKLVTSDAEERVLISQIIQEQLNLVGFSVEIVTLEWGAYLDAMRAGNYHISYWSLGGTALRSSNGTANMKSDAHWNVSQIRRQPALADVSARIDVIVDTASQTVDDQTRFNMLKEFQMLSYEHQLIFWLWHVQSHHVFQPYVKDYILYNYNIIWTYDVWLDR